MRTVTTTYEGRGIHMRRVVVLVATAILAVAAVPAVASASAVSSTLLKGYHERLMASSDTDQWAFESGCTGGTSVFDPLYMVGPLTDPATPESTCSVRLGTPVVAVAASFTCWQQTLRGSAGRVRIRVELGGSRRDRRWQIRTAVRGSSVGHLHLSGGRRLR